MPQFPHGIAYVQKPPLWHVLFNKHLVYFVGVVQRHVVELKDQLRQPIVQTALPPQIVFFFRPIPLVNQVECLAVVLRLGWARHFRLRPLPLPVGVPFLSQHPPPRLEYHGAVDIRQRSDKSIAGSHSKTMWSPCVLPTDGAIRSLLH